MATSVAYTAVVNPDEMKTLLANGFSTFFIKVNPAFSIGPKFLPKILLIVLFYALEFLIILYWLINYLQRLYGASKLVYQLIKTFAKNYSHH